MATAMERVINTHELLEAILLHLDSRGTTVDFRTMLVTQRTCKAFRETIVGSPKLQRALFFKQDRVEPDNGSYTINHFVCNRKRYDVPRPELVPMRLCVGNFVSIGVNGGSVSHFASPDASWRRMYLYSVPRGPDIVTCFPSSKTLKTWMVRVDGTLTIGEMVDEAVEKCRRTGRYLVDKVK